MKMKIAVIGTGISGVGAAYALSKAHEVELFERDDRAGGHSNTVEHMVAGRTLALDTGFIVHNEDTYPNLVRLFHELGVRTQPSEMSFSVACDRHDLEYSGRRPPLTRLTLEIARFLHLGKRALDDPRYADWSLDRYVAEEGYSSRFRDHFLVPLCAALWSTAPSQTLDFPLVYAIRFFANHGILGFRRLRWKTVTGGSQTYVRALEERLRINLSTEVRSIRRLDGGVELRLAGDEMRRFDGVVVATHADQALRLLEDPSEDERRLLGVFGTTENDTVLHTDERFLPRRVSTRGSWNYQLRDCGCDDGRPTMTYYLNKLQRLDEDEHYCVTLNRTAEIDPERIIRRFSYRHPLVTLESMRAQPELPRLNGPRRTAFAGAWQGYCFHEDGLRSGLAAAAAFGASW
ncbi:MAG: NAD(P)/FAD-dependent oxidoreductase [Gaiellaceae bacterium]